MVGSHIAHYQIRRQIGEGGMGVVYEAIDDRDGQHVAIKLMRAEFTRSREALTRFFNGRRKKNHRRRIVKI
jgi:serine/threonine protein kinase